MVKIKNISGRQFKYYEDGENGVSYDSGVYEYKNNKIALEWIDQGWDDRWGNYHEKTIRRWIIIGERPYHRFNFTSITKAADHIDYMGRR